MDDFLSEHEQWERLKAWLRVNGPWIVAGIVVGALLLAGYRWWEARQNQIALEASAKYHEVLKALDANDKTRAQSLITEIENDYASSAYADQARLLSARLAVEAGELDKAAATLKSVMEKTDDRQLSLVARLRLARVQLAQNKPDDALATLNAVQGGAFEPRFDEARGDILLAKGDKAGALKQYQSARQGALTQSVDAQTLDLKIQDLLTDPTLPKTAQVETNAKPGEAK